MLPLHFAVGVQHRFGCRHGMKTRTKHYLSWPHAVGLHSLHCNRSWAPVLKKYVSTSWLAMRLCWNALELWQPKELWAVQGHGFSTAATSPGLNETHWLKRKFWEKSFFRGGSCLEYRWKQAIPVPILHGISEAYTSSTASGSSPYLKFNDEQPQHVKPRPTQSRKQFKQVR